MNHTLETVQAMIVLQFLINHIESFSSRFRTLMAEAVSVSHILGIHMVDAVGNREEHDDADAAITREIKRRVWWYLCVMDWAVSTMQGKSYPSLHEGEKVLIK